MKMMEALKAVLLNYFRIKLMSLKSAQNRLNGKYPMLPYILFFSLIFGFQSGFAMEVDQEVDQDELNQQLVAAVDSYYDRNQQATVVDRVNDLLNRGANPNIVMHHERSPLLYLLIIGNGYENRPVKRRLMELLIRAGADPNCRIIEDDSPISSNTTPLWWSCSVEDRAIFDLLIEHGADIRQRCKNNKTLLHEAARCWNLELCEFLLREGLDVNAADDDGNTPLHFLCNQNFSGDGVWPHHNPDHIPAVIALLLDWGAHINLQNNKGMSALHLAVSPWNCALRYSGAHTEIRPAVKVLLARGADLNLLCRWGNQNQLKSPLELATLVRDERSKRQFKEHRRLCELMITHQVHVNKGALTLLCSLRKIGEEGNEGAGTLYRYRAQLLTPYLQRLYRPLEQLLRVSGASKWRQGIVALSDFRGYRCHFPNSDFNIDFLDPARIPETYQNLNRNIYHGLPQPKIIGLIESNQVINNNNNYEPHREEPLVGVPAPAPNDPDPDDDDSDDDDDNYWDKVRAKKGREFGEPPFLPEINGAKEQPAPKVPQLNSNNSNIPLVALAIAFYGAVGYTLYKCYTNWKKRIEKEKREKKEGRNKKRTPSVASAPKIVYAYGT